mmetsp:Transcript_4581/g.6462  ORF Transcript_4581/g.6462 Transcript_4581/m.6462 type:complete len:86 (-) Transcript_4581:46-303(-)
MPSTPKPSFFKTTNTNAGHGLQFLLPHQPNYLTTNNKRRKEEEDPPPLLRRAGEAVTALGLAPDGTLRVRDSTGRERRLVTEYLY